MYSDLLIILAAYFLGSIPFGLLVARIFGVADIRETGSGNIGATNVYRAAGPIPALLASIGDIGKGVLAVVMAIYLSRGDGVGVEYIKLAAGLAAILGHIFPIFLRFRGGKGVNTALGVFITLLPIPALIALAVFVISVWISRFVSLGSILAAVAFCMSVLLFYWRDPGMIHPIYPPVSILLLLLILMTHLENIRRLLTGREHRFSFRSHGQGGN